MSKIHAVSLVAALLCSFAAAVSADDSPAPAGSGAGVVIPDPAALVATVGDLTVTRGELDRELAHLTRRNPSAEVSPETRQEAIDNLIQRRILTILAKKAGAVSDPKEVDDIIAKQKANFPKEEEYAQRLAEAGLTEAIMREMVAEGSLQQAYVEQAAKDLTVTDEELSSNYEEIKARGDFKRGETADVAHILIKVENGDEAAWTEAKKRIDAARKRVVGGEDFGAVAKDVSEDPGSKDKGGEYKGVTPGQMVPEFDKLTFSQKIGDISEPFRTDYGWHILKVTNRTEGGDTPFDEIKDQLKDYLLNKKKSEIITAQIEKARGELEIKILDAPATPAPDAPAAQ